MLLRLARKEHLFMSLYTDAENAPSVDDVDCSCCDAVPSAGTTPESGSQFPVAEYEEMRGLYEWASFDKYAREQEVGDGRLVEVCKFFFAARKSDNSVETNDVVLD